MKIALAQMLVEGGQPRENLKRAESRIETAAKHGADLILLPEAIDFGWTHPSAMGKAGPIPGGESFERLAKAARQNHINVCAGLIEKNERQLFNSAVALNREGEFLTKHRKINELTIARGLYATGVSVEGICSVEGRKIGLEICADGFAENQWISRKLCEAGAEIILSPCAWAVDRNFDPGKTSYGKIWRDNFVPVAKHYGTSIVACSHVGKIEKGPWEGRICIGNSMVFDSQGTEILTGPFGDKADELLYVALS